MIGMVTILMMMTQSQAKFDTVTNFEKIIPSDCKPSSVNYGPAAALLWDKKDPSSTGCGFAYSSTCNGNELSICDGPDCVIDPELCQLEYIDPTCASSSSPPPTNYPPNCWGYVRSVSGQNCLADGKPFICPAGTSCNILNYGAGLQLSHQLPCNCGPSETNSHASLCEVKRAPTGEPTHAHWYQRPTGEPTGHHNQWESEPTGEPTGHHHHWYDTNSPTGEPTSTPTGEPSTRPTTAPSLPPVPVTPPMVPIIPPMVHPTPMIPPMVHPTPMIPPMVHPTPMIPPMVHPTPVTPPMVQPTPVTPPMVQPTPVTPPMVQPTPVPAPSSCTCGCSCGCGPACNEYVIVTTMEATEIINENGVTITEVAYY